MTDWQLRCSACDLEHPRDQPVGVCEACSQPVFARYLPPAPRRSDLLPRLDMWRYACALPLLPDEEPVSLGEGRTPLLENPELSREVGVRRLLVKDEGLNPTGSFKARGLSAAVTRARALGVPGLTVPTAGNAGAALAAYAAAAGMKARIYAPSSTPRALLATVRTFGAELILVDGHIGDAGALARADAERLGWFDVSTLREPYRNEGNRTLGLELAELLGWRLPDVVVFPTGGGEGIVAMWKLFAELREWRWLDSDATTRMVVAQSTGCAPLVKAFESGAEHVEPWPDPRTHASGIRVPNPLGDRLVLAALRESNGAAVAVDEDAIRAGSARLATGLGVDAAPEGGAGLAAIRELVRRGDIGAEDEVVLFNTGSGASYRDSSAAAP